MLRDVVKIGAELKVSDFTDDETFSAMCGQVGDTIAILDSARHDDDVHDDGNVRSKRKKSKSSHKDAAARKRKLTSVDDDERLGKENRKKTLGALYTLYKKLQCCYLRDDAKGYFGLVLKGVLPDYDKYCHVSYSPDYDAFVGNQSFPDEDEIPYGRVN